MSASRDTEAELVCVDSYGKKSGMGVLGDGGFMFTVPLNLIRKLLNKVFRICQRLRSVFKTDRPSYLAK